MKQSAKRGSTPVHGDQRSWKRLCALVYKPGGLRTDRLGIVSGEAGTLRLMPGLVRIPDVAFVSWRHFPNRRLPRRRIPDLVPDMAVEVLSEGNTEAEMANKLQEYFIAGVPLVGYVDPEARTVQVYTSPRTCAC